MHIIIKFNQKVWLKTCIDPNTELRRSTESDVKEYIFRLMNNAVFKKTMENVRKHSDIKLQEGIIWCQNQI